MLEHWGFEVRVVNQAERALDAARAFLPRLVILDLELPGISGREVARRLREAPELAGCKVAALTGHDRPKEEESIAKAGFDHYLVKPINPAELKRVVILGP
jgi:DNA-binding response OmpR family regulator